MTEEELYQFVAERIRMPRKRTRASLRGAREAVLNQADDAMKASISAAEEAGVAMDKMTMDVQLVYDKELCTWAFNKLVINSNCTLPTPLTFVKLPFNNSDPK